MSEASTVEGKVAIAREFVARVFNEHRPDLAIEYFTPQIRWHGGWLGTMSGAEHVTGLLRSFIGALPDLKAVEEDIVASDDLVVMWLAVSATHQGDLLGIPATGRPVRWDAVDIYRLDDDGKIIEEWAADDMEAFARQLAALSAPDAGDAIRGIGDDDCAPGICRRHDSVEPPNREHRVLLAG
jgi:predicted ester cyclase